MTTFRDSVFGRYVREHGVIFVNAINKTLFERSLAESALVRQYIADCGEEWSPGREAEIAHLHDNQ